MSTLSRSASLGLGRSFSLIGTTFSLLALARSRQALADLDPRALDDIGLTRDDARREAGRPAWDVPANWLK
ncbi:hypothetical protein OB2597_10039 [Pseudooceanicola batsensis HTCC2597]|uniref:YjiS-like domain-containing protein n=1 Tax=Pseudooceanicola batsensis (strain ATCC BAA-863 / DSM 15984 / KCTC 12145 / HTCC2597) TaxID=252305 RepID=A3TVD0_PSEBH|nr:DUF1127 domain-containing protein [Pseudooceanicola batsensis]EAQ04476.1 hypothetical protein OB2597_10039 [Pseudooceanicola batsensis HTCC2597]